MSDFSILLERNRDFAAQYHDNLSIIPRFSTIILTCTDSRIDPAHYLGLELNDALVIRNAGARVTHDIELEIGVLWSLAERMAGDGFKGFSLAIIHHTDCGYERIAHPDIQQMLSHKLGIDKAIIGTLGISDHMQTLKNDIEQLRQSSLVPKQLTVTGYLYDVHTGEISEIIKSTTLT